MDECQTSFSSYKMSLHFVLFIKMKLYVYNYLGCAKMRPTFNYYYSMLREEADVDQAIN